VLLVVDIGNSSTVMGIRSDGGSIARRWRLRSDADRTPDELGVVLRALLDGAPSGIRFGCVASVVPPLTGVFVEAARDHLGIEIEEFRYGPELGIRLEVDEPGRVGPDRIANTLAAHLEHPGPAIVVDFGTATNFDVVSAEGAFLGGIIAPGLESGFERFAARTALLPRIAPAFPGTFIGKDTVANMQIGVYRGATAMVDGLVESLRGEWRKDARVIATGGFSRMVAPHCRTVDVVDPDLTLKGVGWAYDRRHPRTA
jgi:type III pantothenate kinase